MSMNLTIRRITKLVNKIDIALHETTREATLTSHKTVFIHDASGVVAKQMDASRAEWRRSMLDFIQLYDIRRTLREMVGKANAENGVNDLVTELRAVESCLGFFSNMRTRTGKEPRLESSEMSNRLTAYRKAGEKAQVEVATWRVGRDTDSNTQSFIVLEQLDIDWLRNEEKALRARVEGITDQLERINASVEIKISEELEERLKELELIPGVKSL